MIEFYSAYSGAENVGWITNSICIRSFNLSYVSIIGTHDSQHILTARRRHGKQNRYRIARKNKPSRTARINGRCYRTASSSSSSSSQHKEYTLICTIIIPSTCRRNLLHTFLWLERDDDDDNDDIFMGCVMLTRSTLELGSRNLYRHSSASSFVCVCMLPLEWERTWCVTPSRAHWTCGICD